MKIKNIISGMILAVLFLTSQPALVEQRITWGIP